MTENKSLQTYKKAEVVKQIKSQIVSVKTSYDLVRLDDIMIADETSKEIVAEMILELNEFSNLSRKMSGPQIIETVNMLLDEYSGLSLQEYQVFFNRIKKGEFGQLYESMDGIKIMTFMKEFYADMVKSYHEFKDEDHQQIKRVESHRDL